MKKGKQRGFFLVGELWAVLLPFSVMQGSAGLFEGGFGSTGATRELGRN
jgi:hypothetical protein